MNIFWKGSMILLVCIITGFLLAYLFVDRPEVEMESNEIVTDIVPETTSARPWEANLTVSPYMTKDASYASSAKLSVHWDGLVGAIDHVVVMATDTVSSETLSVTTNMKEEEAVLIGLKSATIYEVSVQACVDKACKNILTSEVVQGETQEEYWQIQGEDSGYNSAHQIVENGSTLSYAIPYTDWAPENLRGTIKFYYNGSGPTNDLRGIRVASSTEGYTDFENSKQIIRRECGTDISKSGEHTGGDCAKGQLQALAIQILPLESGVMKAFFEATSATDPEKIMEVYSLNSQDGYIGEDFDTSPSSDICGDSETEQDLIKGGDCEPTLVIESSEHGGSSGLVNARQNKIGYPILDSWIWDESPGTFMIITAEDACEKTRDGLFYVVYDGTNWIVQKDASGCAIPLVLEAHGPVIVHLGGDRYKVYYENYEFADEQKLIEKATKPTRVMYAAGGADGMVDLEDWEGEDVAREVNFLWPDGTVLDVQEEAGLGDHVIWVPDGDLETQVMYMNLGGFDNINWKKGSGGLGMAVLVNP